jgi:predicted SAM-dependent methyltransferase
MNLHIGCYGAKIEGFKRLDIFQHGDVDYVQDAKDLSNFTSESVEEIYASHVFEHFKKGERQAVLKEWWRVLKPKGVLWISVPDFDAVVELYCRNNKVLSVWTDHLIHGDQKDDRSIHYACYNYATLTGELSMAGFSKMERIEQMPYGLLDASCYTDNAFGIPISINVKVVK